MELSKKQIDVLSWIVIAGIILLLLFRLDTANLMRANRELAFEAVQIADSFLDGNLSASEAADKIEALVDEMRRPRRGRGENRAERDNIALITNVQFLMGRLRDENPLPPPGRPATPQAEIVLSARNSVARGLNISERSNISR